MDKNMKIAAICVVAIVAIAGAGVAMTMNKSSDTAYKIAVVKHNFEPLYIAEEKGFFSDAGVDVELVSVASGNDAMVALTSGKVDLAGFGSDPFLKMIDSYGDDYKYIARWMLDEGLKAAAREDCTYSFNGGSDSLIGAKIGVNTAVSYYSLLLKYLSQTEQEYVLQTDIDTYDANKVNIYSFTNQTLAAALTTGKVDLIIAGATNINVVESQSGYKYIEASGEYVSYMSVGMFAKTSNIDACESDYRKILEAIDRACKYMTSDDAGEKDDAIDICMGKLNITNKTVMTKYIDLAQWGVTITDDDRTSIQDSFEYIVKSSPGKYTGELKDKETLDINPYLDTRFVAA
ncbi:MAG: ABC transporter substrate-binding protein [Candidatus Methanomethylophilaceae archaeon]